MFDHKRFKREVSDLLDQFDSGALDRAWEITCGLMEVVAKVDKRDDESLAASRQAAWLDFYRCWNDEQATYTYWGMYEEMRHSVREKAEELEHHIIDIGRSCDGRKPSKSKARKNKSGKKTSTATRKSRQKEPRLRATGHPHLRVVES